MSFPRIAWIRNKQMYRQSEKNSKNRLGICSLGGDVSKIETLDFCFAVMRYITVSFRIHHQPPARLPLPVLDAGLLGNCPAS